MIELTRKQDDAVQALAEVHASVGVSRWGRTRSARADVSSGKRRASYRIHPNGKVTLR